MALSGTYSPICWCQASESLQKGDICRDYAPTDINHGYGEMTSCTTFEKVVNRLGVGRLILLSGIGRSLRIAEGGVLH